MVATLVTGSTRKVGTKKNETVGYTSANRVSGRRRQRKSKRKNSPQQRDQQQSSATVPQVTKPSPTKKLAREEALATAGSVAKQVQAVLVANFIFWTAISFYVPQLVFWLLGILFIGMESVTFVNYFVPGELLYTIMYACIMLIGVCTMVYAAFIFTLRGIDCFGGWKGFIFIVCLAGYLVIGINFFPWFVVWIYSVSYLQK